MKWSECVDESTAWMGAKHLKLNSEKIEMSWFYYVWNLKNTPSYFVLVIESNIISSKTVMNLEISMQRPHNVKNCGDGFYLCVK